MSTSACQCVLCPPSSASLPLSPGLAGAASGLEHVRKGSFTGKGLVVGWDPAIFAGQGRGGGMSQLLHEQQALRVLAVLLGPRVRCLTPGL